jgi:mannitol 2-dehydrogenase
MSITRLNGNNLSRIPERVVVPQYERSNINSGIVHVGVGNFHRAHEAYYTDQLLNLGEKNWGICGVCLLDRDLKMYETLAEQDGLYSLVVKEPDGNLSVRVIGSIVEYLYAPTDPTSVISKMADPSVKIISLTITEGGYNYDASTGEFLFSEPEIQWDLQHPDRPKTIFGYLAAALLRRKKNGTPGFTVLSCDNIQQNGKVCKKMLMTYLRECQPDLASWTEHHVTFPNCMVDRITPVTSEQDIEDLRSEYQLEDRWPVVCEPFIQWVIEDHFTQGRPDWGKVGVRFVKEVEPYEKMKIRLLNAGHSLLGFSGSLYGFKTIDETVRNPMITAFLRKFMDHEASPVLGKIKGVDLGKYKNNLLQRFANPYIGDQLSRICSESSSKIPKFLLPTIREQLEKGGSLECSALIIAAWCRNLELTKSAGDESGIQDTMKEILIEGAKASMDKDPLAFLKLSSVFGNLVRSEEFVETYLRMIENLRKHGIDKAVRMVVEAP